MPRLRSIVKKSIIILPLFIIIPVIILFSLFNKPLIVFPHEKYKDRLVTYSDDESGGNSRIIDFNILNNKIIYTYMLKKSHISAYVGLSFDVSLLDISSYDILTLKLTATVPARYLVTLMSFSRGESRLSELDTIIHFNKEIEIKEASQLYRIDMRTMIKSGYKKTDNTKSRYGTSRPTNLLFIHLKEMINVDNIKENEWSFDKIKTIIIEEIAFHRSYVLYYILLTISIVIYYSLAIIILLFIKRRKNESPREKKDLPFIQLEVESYQEEDLNKIMNSLKEHVFEPDFSIHMVYHMTGISELRISRLIKEKYNLSFKQLINSIRLNEAKRLLTESDLKIYDIAFKIGYNNNTYFCKLFKNQFSITPKEFRCRDNN